MSGAPLSLNTSIHDMIQRDGFITVAEYMALVTQAYYARGDVFGRTGDFTTAPEISQTFGEIIGLWCAVTWQQMGAPAAFNLVECGPGRGTLMTDALRATKSIPGFAPAARLHLVEQSHALRAMQKKALSGHDITWHADLTTLPQGPLIVVGNEFLDALPVRQFQRTADGWTERVIKLDGQSNLTFATIPTSSAPIPIPLAMSSEVGAIFERSDAITTFIHQLAEFINARGGAALLIDYGHSISALGDTLQAVKRHQYHDVLTNPGEADITAHVDFGHIGTVAKTKGLSVFGPLEQGVWLRRLGIGVRQVQLAKNKAPETARVIEQGVRRLTEPHGMGALFKVLALGQASLSNLEGFLPDDEEMKAAL